MDQNIAGVYVLNKKVSQDKCGKIKEVVYVGPQIRDLMQDVKFEGQLSGVEKTA
jgi:hypothetical protein